MTHRYLYTMRILFEPVPYPLKKPRAQLRLWQERRASLTPATHTPSVMTHRYFYTRRIFFEPVSYPQKKARGQLRLWPERRSCQLPTPPVMTRRQPISYRQNKTKARSYFGQPHFDSNSRTTPSGKKRGANVLFLALFHVHVECSCLVLCAFVSFLHARDTVHQDAVNQKQTNSDKQSVPEQRFVRGLGHGASLLSCEHPLGSAGMDVTCLFLVHSRS